MQRRKKSQPKARPKKPKAPKVVYVTDSSDEEEYQAPYQAQPHNWINFV